MGQAEKKSRNRASILAGEARCIYCEAPPTQLEHMPPKSMFRGSSRPSGMEFAACAACNNGTSASDLVASFIARLRSDDVPDAWEIREANDRKSMLELKAPGVIRELFHPDKSRELWRSTGTGVLTRAVEVKADGPLLRGYLTTFATKMGMALYREHVGTPLPMHGAAFTQWFLNAGLAQKTGDTLLTILPGAGTLRQGTFQVGEQFAYRFNSDQRSIVAALVRFHQGLYVFTIATSEPEKYSLQRSGPTTAIARPGALNGLMPPKGRRFWR
jgi:hypothetical protein